MPDMEDRNEPTEGEDQVLPEPGNEDDSEPDLAAALAAREDGTARDDDPPAPGPAPAREQPGPNAAELAHARARIAELERRELSLRGQTENAAKQAREQAKIELARDERTRILAQLDEAEKSGQYDAKAVQDRRESFRTQWKAEDLEQKERDLAARDDQFREHQTRIQAETLIQEARNVSNKIGTEAARVFAETTGLPLDMVKAEIDTPDVRKGAMAAYLQSSLYDTNAFQLYMDALGDRIDVVKRYHDRQERGAIDNNRNAAAASGAHNRQPTAAGGRPRTITTLDEAGDELLRRFSGK